MTEPEAALRALVRNSTKGVLATMKRDGRPQLSNVAYSVGVDDVLRISTPSATAKVTNLRRDPRASLHVARGDFWGYAVVEGDAQLTEPAADPDDATVEALAEHYRSLAGEHPDWAEFRAAMVAKARVLVTLPIERLYGEADLGDIPPAWRAADVAADGD